MIKVSLILTFLAFSLGQLGRLSFLNQEVNVYIYEIIILFTLSLLLARYKLLPLKTAVKKYAILPLLLSVTIISFMISIASYSLSQNIISFLYLLRFWSYGLYGIYLYWHIKNNGKIHETIKTGLIGVFILTCATSIIQFLLYPDLRNLNYLGWDPHWRRLFGVFFDTSIAAGLFGMVFFFLLSLRHSLIRNTYIASVLTVTYLFFMVLTFSRSAYIAGLLAFSLYVFQSKKIVYLFLGLTVVLTLFIISPKEFGSGVGLDRTFSIRSRLIDYVDAYKLWSKYPVFGIGYNRIRYARLDPGQKLLPVEDRGQSHAGASFSSSYLIVLVTTGLVGLVVFGTLLLKLALQNQFTKLIFTFIGVLSFTDNILLHPFILFLLGSMLVFVFSRPSGMKRR